MGSATNPDLQSEDTRVFNWRLDQFERLGFSTSDAAELALSPVDVHRLAELVAHGCELELARKILG